MGTGWSRRVDKIIGNFKSTDGSSSENANERSLDNLPFSSYENACDNDADVQKFNTKLRQRTVQVLDSVSKGAEEERFSFDALKEATEGLVDVDYYVLEVIMEFNEDIWKNKELYMLVKEFFANSLATLEFCAATESCINRAKEDLTLLTSALKLLPKDGEPSEIQSKSIMNVLTHIRAAESPFGENFFTKLEHILNVHRGMLSKLTVEKRKLDKKLKHIKMWAKVSAILLGAAAVAVVICGIIAAFMTAPVIAGAFAAAAAVPTGSVNAWLKSMWNKYRDDYHDQLKLLQEASKGTIIATADMENIKRLATSLEIKLKDVLSGAVLLEGSGDVGTLRFVVEDIMAKSSKFEDDLNKLQKYVDDVGQRIRGSRNVVLDKINKLSRNEE
ncbi:hypothetical protein KP509_17G036900 [Ceratopteris richardii]|uniref:Uncharacterized protein n=1 Tax=Ceratopteris richardii TaxID=49495 RepID=A0A8T2SXH1_CERRI|nr:hypothetical protein KP509_17G036900 [Ceratopteris richardii]